MKQTTNGLRIFGPFLFRVALEVGGTVVNFAKAGLGILLPLGPLINRGTHRPLNVGSKYR